MEDKEGLEFLEEAFSSFSEQMGRIDFACSIYCSFWLALLHANILDFLLH